MRVILAIALLASFCDAPSDAPPPVGAVRLHTTIAGANLYVDAVDRGPLRDAMEIELTPGSHVIEARRGDDILAHTTFNAQAALIFDLTLAESMPPMQPPIPPSEPSGGLPTDQMQRVIRAGSPGLRQCFEEHASADVLRLQVSVVIRAEGSVESAHTEGGSDDDAPLRECIDAHVRTWMFPAASESTTTVFPLNFQSATEPPPAGAPDHETPSRGEVIAALNGVSDEVRACGGNGAAGTASVRLVFDGSTGNATNATVTGGSFPPAVVSCIENAARAARVEPFSQPMFSVNYPFRL